MKIRNRYPIRINYFVIYIYYMFPPKNIDWYKCMTMADTCTLPFIPINSDIFCCFFFCFHVATIPTRMPHSITIFYKVAIYRFQLLHSPLPPLSLSSHPPFALVSLFSTHRLPFRLSPAELTELEFICDQQQRFTYIYQYINIYPYLNWHKINKTTSIIQVHFCVFLL